MLMSNFPNGEGNTKGGGLFLHYMYLQCLKFIGRVMVRDTCSELTFMEIKHCLLQLLATI